MQLRDFVKISRPRFWVYTAGPYLVGVAAGLQNTDQFLTAQNIFFLLYFLFPANLLIYGINDIFDQETDARNPKKVSHEKRLQQNEMGQLTLVLALVGVLSTGLFFVLPNTATQWWLLAFLILSIGYSMPPLRFKAIPLADAYSNLLYACAGFFGYALFTGMHPSPKVFFAALTFAAALHTFSAIPDITVDKKAGITTTAVWLGKFKALLFVGWNWLVSAILFWEVLGIAALPLFAYPLIAGLLMSRPTTTLEKVYWRIPYLNGVLGFLGFWGLVLGRFGYREVLAAFGRLVQ